MLSTFLDAVGDPDKEQDAAIALARVMTHDLDVWGASQEQCEQAADAFERIVQMAAARVRRGER